MSSTNMSTTRSNSRAIPAAPQHNCLIPNGAASDTSCYYEAEDLVNYTGGGGEASLKSAHRLSELANNDYNTGYSASSFYPCQKFSLQNGDHQIHVINPPPNSYYWEIRESKFRKNKKFRPVNKFQVGMALEDPLEIRSTRASSTLLASTVDSHSPHLTDDYRDGDDGGGIIISCPTVSSSTSPHFSVPSPSVSSSISSSSSLYSFSPTSSPMNLFTFEDPLSLINYSPPTPHTRSHLQIPFTQTTDPTTGSLESEYFLSSSGHPTTTPTDSPADQNDEFLIFLRESAAASSDESAVEQEEREPSPPPLSPPIIITEGETVDGEDKFDDYFDAFSHARGKNEESSSEEELPDIDDLPIVKPNQSTLPPKDPKIISTESSSSSGTDSENWRNNLDSKFLPFPPREFDERIDYSSYLHGSSPMSNGGQGAVVIDGQVRHWRERIFPPPGDQKGRMLYIFDHGGDKEEDLSDDKFLRRHAKYEREEKRVNRLYLKQQKEKAAVERAKQREYEREQSKLEKYKRINPRRSSNSSIVIMDKKEENRRGSFRSSSSHERNLRCPTRSRGALSIQDDFQLEICILDEA